MHIIGVMNSFKRMMRAAMMVKAIVCKTLYKTSAFGLCRWMTFSLLSPPAVTSSAAGVSCLSRLNRQVELLVVVVVVVVSSFGLKLV